MARALGHAMPFGAELRADGSVRFRLWAPDANRVQIAIENGEREPLADMDAEPGGWFALIVPNSPAGTRYRFRIDGETLVPDPASRFQPDGVDGPSAVVDPSRYAWRTNDWRGRRWSEVVLYELHVGTFTAEGTLESAAERLDYLAELGVTAVELMPVGTFPGVRNWGYDGVLPYAPHAVYGGPEALRAFVDAAHAHELMVLLDVVYNHFGPQGNYLHRYAGRFFTRRHRTPWGDAIDFDGDQSRPVRDFFLHNALYWLEEYRLDGLRLDAVHAIVDDSEPNIIEELADAVHAGPGRSRTVHLVLENDANTARYLRRGAGKAHPRYAAQWNDDFHHACHALLTGEADGYYVDYADRPLEHLRRCLTEGYAYQGEPSRHRGGATRGEPSSDLPTTAFIAFLQNHDQIGNRALGERLASLAATGPLRAVTSLMLLAPFVPALFMGEEFGCRQPFWYFADFDDGLAAAVREGRRREFASFERFGGSTSAVEPPDPAAERTFRRCVLDWRALDDPGHAAWVALYRKLLSLRARIVVPRLPATRVEHARSFGGTGLIVCWRMRDGALLTITANLGDRSTVERAPEPGRVIHAEPSAAMEGSEMPPWSVRWRLAAEAE